MDNLIEFRQPGMLTNIDQLPPHIRYDEYLRMRDVIKEYWECKTSKKRKYYKDRDLLLIDLAWETGGRIDDICHILKADLNFSRKELNLYTKKRKKTVVISLTLEMLLFISQYTSTYKKEYKLFNFSRVRAWQIVKKYGRLSNIHGLHPHKFRHGIAVYLRGKGVPIEVIAARLGHSNAAITSKYYQKITPDIQAFFLKDIKMREEPKNVN